MHIRNGEFLLGDCFEHMAALPDASVDMVLTDIPYNEVNRRSNGLRSLDKGVADSSEINLKSFTLEISRLCPGSAYVFCGIKQISVLIEHFEKYKWSTRLGIWHKTNPSPMNGQRLWLSGSEACVFARRPNAVFNEHCKSAVWSCSSQQSKIHPTQKPEKLFERLINASTHKDMSILDPFAGSGTTAVAAERCGRRWICIERDADYYAKAIERIENLGDLV